jgi:hypothetical protein
MTPCNTPWSAAELACSLDDSDGSIPLVNETLAPSVPRLRAESSADRDLIFRGKEAAPPGLREHEALVTTLDSPWYHATEACEVGKLRSAGRASVSPEIRAGDPDGHEIPHGVAGEVAGGRPSLLQGYWTHTELPALDLNDDWMHSGDGTNVDPNGLIFIINQLKAMIISGGRNAYCVEAQNALARHPAVAECAIIGNPSERWGESAHVEAVPNSDAKVATGELIAQCKAPRTMNFINAPVLGRFSRSHFTSRSGGDANAVCHERH